MPIKNFSCLKLHQMNYFSLLTCLYNNKIKGMLCKYDFSCTSQCVTSKKVNLHDALLHVMKILIYVSFISLFILCYLHFNTLFTSRMVSNNHDIYQKREYIVLPFHYRLEINEKEFITLVFFRLHFHRENHEHTPM